MEKPQTSMAEVWASPPCCLCPETTKGLKRGKQII